MIFSINLLCSSNIKSDHGYMHISHIHMKSKIFYQYRIIHQYCKFQIKTQIQYTTNFYFLQNYFIHYGFLSIMPFCRLCLFLSIDKNININYIIIGLVILYRIECSIDQISFLIVLAIMFTDKDCA
jgi:hypothetical protein